jgi:hypothetical protein
MLNMILNNRLQRTANLVIIAMALLIGFITITQAQAQPDPPQTLATAKDEEGVFCGFEESESGDSPDTITVQVGPETYYLSVGVETQEEYDQLVGLDIGSPIEYDFSVINYYNESGGERETYVFIKKLHSSSPPNIGVCRP